MDKNATCYSGNHVHLAKKISLMDCDEFTLDTTSKLMKLQNESVRFDVTYDMIVAHISNRWHLKIDKLLSSSWFNKTQHKIQGHGDQVEF